MKKFILLLAALTLAASQVTAQNNKRDPYRMVVKQVNGQVQVMPVVEVGEVAFESVGDLPVTMVPVDAKGSSIIVDCDMPKGASRFALMAVEATAETVSLTEAEALVAKGEAQDCTKSGIYTVGGLMNGHDYTLVALAYDTYGIASQTSQVNARTTDEAAFTITYSDVTWKDAHVVITPTDPTMKYYYSTMRIEKLNNEMGGDINNVLTFDMDWWKYASYLSGEDVNVFIQRDLVSGTQEFCTSGDEGANIFMWDSKGIVYCYGMNDKGERITALNYVIIDTRKPEPSSMTFDVEILEAFPKTVHATVTPSTDEPYYLSAQKKTFVDYYLNLGEIDEMCFKLLLDDPEMVGLQQGPVNVDESLFPTLTPAKEYCLLMFGFKDGRTTDLKVVNFNTLKTGTSSQYSFEYYFLNEEGTDVDSEYMTKVSDGVYTYMVEDGKEILDTWKSLTGWDISSAGETYDYSYDSKDSTGIKYHINASRHANAQGEYGFMDVTNPEYPYIQKIIFVE